jgi:hypothetical protein
MSSFDSKSKNEMIILDVTFEVLDIAKTKFDISNQLWGLKEFFVLSTTKLFAGSQKNGMNTSECSYMNMHYMKNYGISLYRIFLGGQHMTTTFLEVRKEEGAHCTQSTHTHHYKNKQKVNAMLNIITYFLYKVNLLLALYDYKFKIAIVEDKRS